MSAEIRPEECRTPKSRADQRSAGFQVTMFHALRLLMGVVFLYASYDKLFHPEAFAKVVYNYQILPDAVVNLAALILPWFELLLGLCLVAGFWLPGATLSSTGLLAVFIGALVFNQIRGLDIHCGCFSIDATDGPAGLLTIARDVGFLVLSILLTVHVYWFRTGDSTVPFKNVRR